jgi:phosphate transport system substrate-binding protein
MNILKLLKKNSWPLFSTFLFLILFQSQFLSSLAHGSNKLGTVKIDGSSTVFPITEAVSEEFQISQKGKVRVTVGISGTGGGFKKFCRGETDVQNASRPILKVEMEQCKAKGIKYYEIPVAFDAMTIVVNPQNNWVKEISLEELKKIWEPGAAGKITHWNHIRPTWPKEKIKLYGAGADSGTFDYFTEVVNGKAKASRGDYTASEDDNTLVMGISKDKFALGYLPYAYYELNKTKLKALGVIGGKMAPKKEAILPSRMNVENGTYFPLSRPIFIYVNSASALKPEVKEFTHFYLKNARLLVDEVKSVPLPQKIYDLSLELIKKAKTGSAFNGVSEVGVGVEEILKREVRH